MKIENDYRVVLEFSWKSALGMFRKKSLQICLSIFLEINIKPFTESTVWFPVLFSQKLNEYFSETKVATDKNFKKTGFYKMVGPKHAILGQELAYHIMVQVCEVNLNQNVEEIPRGCINNLYQQLIFITNHNMNYTNISSN